MKKMLMIECNAQLSKIFKQIIEKNANEAIQVETVGTGVSGVTKVKQGNQYDLISTCLMPSYIGFRAAEDIRNIGYKGPIISMTYARIDENIRFHAKHLKIDAIFEKTLNPCILLERLASFGLPVKVPPTNNFTNTRQQAAL